MSNYPNCTWYVYPTFVLNFLRHPPSWSSWRTRTERASRGSKEKRPIIYFNSLKEELLLVSDDRCQDVDFPWDDEAIAGTVSDDVGGYNESGSSSSKKEPAAGKDTETKRREKEERKVNTEQRKTLKKREEENKKIKKLEKRRYEEEQLRMKEAERRREISDSLSPLGMYWLPRMSLPAICLGYDRKVTVDGTSMWKLTLKPVCCSTYHYIMETDRSSCEHLNEDLLRQCHDERTVDFTMALIDFTEKYKADWTESVSSLSDDMSHRDDSIFVWPAYIIDLMEEYRSWSVWRKKAERANGGKKRKAAYLSVLLGEFEENLSLQLDT